MKGFGEQRRSRLQVRTCISSKTACFTGSRDAQLERAAVSAMDVLNVSQSMYAQF